MATPSPSSAFPNSAPPAPTVLSRRTLVAGKKYDYVELSIRTAAGRALQRQVVRHPGAVVVVPITDDGRVVLIRNFRVAVNQWLYECCAGTLERSRTPEGEFGDGEDPALCAGRELIEETGYKAANIRHLGTFFTTPGLTDERMHAYLATGLEHVGQKLEEDEHIAVELVSVEEAMKMVLDGRMVDAKSMLALVLARMKGAFECGG